MKTLLKTVTLLLLAGVALTGCTIEKKIYQNPQDRTPPVIPRGVTSVTGDEYVELFWFESDEVDLAGYRVYRSYTPDGEYVLQATVHTGYHKDVNVVNGTTYYYAVASFDLDGNESELSPEDVFDTPRPAGFNLMLFDSEYRGNLAGFDFSAQRRVAFDNPAADIVVSYDSTLGVFFIDVGNIDTDIQDFGFTKLLDDVDWAPDGGWSNVGWAEVIAGHAYIIWTADNHYAKFRVTEIGTNSILIDWAYQSVIGNPELKPAAHRVGFLRPSARTAVMGN